MEDDPSRSTKTRRIAVFGFYGNENLGDEAIVEAVIDNVRELIPGAEPTCISVNPVDSRERHGVTADPIFPPAKSYRSIRERMAEQKNKQATSKPKPSDSPDPSSLRTKIKNLPLISTVLSSVRVVLKLPGTIARQRQFAKHIRSVLKRTDAVLISGSNQFLDNFGGPSAFPWTLWLWTYLAKKMNTPVAVMSVGAGPISSPLSMRLIKSTIGRLDYLSFRDTGSVAVVGLDTESTNVLPDLAFSHQSDTAKSALSRDFSLERPPVVAINPMAVHARGYWHEADDDKYGAYVDKLAKLAVHLQQEGPEFIFVANHPRDELVIEDIIEKASAAGCARTELESRVHVSMTTEEYLQNVCKSDIVIATRFHANVLALLLARPVIGLCYHRKSAELLDRFSLGEHASHMDEFEVSDVIDSIATLTQNYDSQTKKIAERTFEYRDRLMRQYEDVKRAINTV